MGGVRARSRIRAVAIILLLLPLAAAMPPTAPVSASGAPEPEPVDPAPLLAPAPSESSEPPRVPAADAPAPADVGPVLEHYGRAPLHFEPNLGQTHEDVLFLTRAAGYTLFLTRTEAVFVVPEPPEEKEAAVDSPDDAVRRYLLPHEELESLHGGASRAPLVERVVRMRFVEANPAPRTHGFEQLPGISNYFIGNEPGKWTTDVPHYARVRMEDVWPGIDIVFYGMEGRAVEYDFVVAPGADPGVIRLVYDGADVELEEDGSLLVTAGRAALRQPAPYAYQVDAAFAVESEFRLDVLGEVTIALGSYDPRQALVIDPMMLSYSTFLGGSSEDVGTDIAVNNKGNAYITGYTRSTNFPRLNAYQPNRASGEDAFITKLTSGGGALAYSTYLGGTGTDYGTGIVIDSSGHAYIVGQTTSINLPTRNPRQATNGGGFDAFITKLSPNGNSLVYSTYLGGSGHDYGHAIALDQGNSATITGNTNSENFPTYLALQPSYGGGGDAFISRLAPAGTGLSYSTYLGGSYYDIGLGIAVDAAGSAHVTGYTLSHNFPTRAPLQASSGGSADAFVAKVAPLGLMVEHSTFFGGSGNDIGMSVAVDADERVYVTGYTNSPNLPTRSVFQSSPPSSSFSAFVMKLEPAGPSIAYSRYLGGSSVDVGAAILVDSGGNAYVTGYTSSDDFPLGSAFQTFKVGGDDAFITKLTAGGAVAYSTYLGGGAPDAMTAYSDDRGHGIALDDLGNIYFAGFTASSDFPTRNAFQSAYGGSYDAFVAKMTPPVSLARGSSVIDTRPSCAGTGQTCPVTTLGFADDIAAGTPIFFNLQLGDLDAHGDRRCALDDTCGHWLKLGMSLEGYVPEADGIEVRYGILQWQAPDKSWRPGIELNARTRQSSSTGEMMLDISPAIHLPIRAFDDAAPVAGFQGDVLAVRIIPQANPWHPDGAAWELKAAEAQVQLVGRPVILLHGWDKEPHKTNYRDHSGEWQKSFIVDLRARAIHELGQDPWVVFGDDGLSWLAYHAKQDYRESAELELRSRILLLGAATRYQGRVDLIAHSMGGLVARSLVEPGARDHGSLVGKILTMNSPHEGSILAVGWVMLQDGRQESHIPGRDRYYLGDDERNLGEYVRTCHPQYPEHCYERLSHWRPWWDDTIRAKRFYDGEPLLADFALRPFDGPGGNPILERLHGMGRAAGVEYLLIGGRPAIPMWNPVLGWRDVPSPHDGVVSFKSALYPSDRTLCKASTSYYAYPLTAHSAVTWQPDVRELAYRFITGASSPCDGIGGGPQTAALDTTGRGAEVWSTPARLSRIDGVSPASSQSASADTLVFQWEVSAAENATFILHAPKALLNGESVRLVSPDGRTGTIDGGSFDGAYWGVFTQDEFVDYLLVHVPDAADGTWSIELFGAAPGAFVDAYSVLDTSYELQVTLDGSATLLKPTIIEATLHENETPMLGATVTGRVLSQQWGEEAELEFRDDGAWPDRSANDGVFTARFQPAFPGEYELQVEAAKGPIGRSFTRGLPVLLHFDEARSRCVLMLARHLGVENVGQVYVSDWSTACMLDL